MVKIYSKLEKTLFGVLVAGALTLGVMSKLDVNDKYIKSVAYPLLGVALINGAVKFTSKYPKK